MVCLGSRVAWWEGAVWLGCWVVWGGCCCEGGRVEGGFEDSSSLGCQSVQPAEAPCGCIPVPAAGHAGRQCRQAGVPPLPNMRMQMLQWLPGTQALLRIGLYKCIGILWTAHGGASRTLMVG